MFSKKKKKTTSAGGTLPTDEFFAAAERDKEADDNQAQFNELDRQPEWIDQETEEGQLSVDVYENGPNIVVKSTIAGVEPDDVDISITNDMLTIRGERKAEKEHQNRNYFFQECYWGAFSRSIILPVEVDVKKIDATIKNGILTVLLPKIEAKTKKSIKVKEEE